MEKHAGGKAFADNLLIRLSEKTDIKKYTDLLQRTYSDTYTDETIGLTKDCFSKKIFNSIRIQNYLKSNIRCGRKQKTWLAFSGSKLIGAITIADKGIECELRGFYVDTKFQGIGLGKLLMRLALNFTGKKDIVLDTYVHNKKAISIYKKWGFKADRNGRIFYYRYAGWPRGLHAKFMYMRLKINNAKI